MLRPVRSSRLPFALSLALSVALATACAPSDGTDGEGLDAPDRVLAWEPETVYVVGGASAPDWATFGTVNDVAFDGAGNLYVLDGQASTVVKVAPDGSHATTLGGPGQGPGELAQPMAMTATADGRVVVADLGHRGLVVFGADGEWERNAPVDLSVEGLPTTDLQPHPDGGIIAEPGIRFRSGGADAAPPPPGRPIHRYDLDEDGEVADVYVAWDPPEPPAGGESELSGSGSGGRMSFRMARLQAFEPGLHVAVLPDGRLVVADSSAYSLALVDPATGTVIERLGRPVPPVQVDARIEELERERQLELAARRGGLRMVGGGGGVSVDQAEVRRMMEDRVDNMVFYPEIPVVEDLAADPEGRIWVQRASGTPGEDGPTDLITADGRYLGSLPPDGIRIPDAFGPDGLIAIIERDELDVPSVRVARVPTGG